MKYIKTFESHRSSKDEKINEEFFGLNKLIGNLFKKAKAYINKIKGGQEVEAIYKKYLNNINNEFSKQANVDLNIVAANELGEGKTPEVKKQPSDNSPGGTASTPGTASIPEKASYKYNRLIKENDEPQDTNQDSKTNIQNLKAKKSTLDQIIKKNKENALKEMDNILKKYGGSAENPQLSIIINTKKDQFDLDFLSAQINYLEKSGDKTLINEYTKQRDEIARKIENNIKNIETVKAIEIKQGDKYAYKRDGYEEEEDKWKKLSSEDKSNPESEGFKKLLADGEIGYAEILRIDGDTVIFKGGKDEEGNTKEIKKTKDKILGKPKSEGSVEGSVEGQEELTDNLKIVKETNPEGIKTVNKVANLLKDPNTNKEKIDQLNQILGENK